MKTPTSSSIKPVDDLLLRIKRELGGIFQKGRRCGERLRAKAGGRQSLAHTRWSGGKGASSPQTQAQKSSGVCRLMRRMKLLLTAYLSPWIPRVKVAIFELSLTT